MLFHFTILLKSMPASPLYKFWITGKIWRCGWINLFCGGMVALRWKAQEPFRLFESLRISDSSSVAQGKCYLKYWTAKEKRLQVKSYSLTQLFLEESSTGLKQFQWAIKILSKKRYFSSYNYSFFSPHLDKTVALVAVKMRLPTSSRQVIERFACVQRRLREDIVKILLSTTASEEGLEEPDPHLSELHGHRDRRSNKNKFSHGKYQLDIR